MTLLAAAKGYWQKNKGFDSTELSWLWAYGARTHFIHSGIRYFSFFTDAGLFGASMGLSCTVFTLTFFYTKNLFLRLFYLIVGMAGFYGLLISGTRSAIAVPIAGLGLFLFLSKSWKIGIISFILLAGGIGMLKYTKIGENNKLIRRMRTVFDTEDQSMMARFENQKALNAYMDEMPFGIGMGAIGKGKINKGHYPAQKTPYLHGAAMLLKKTIIDKLSLMPEEYFLYYEELDWCTYINREGYELWYDPACEIWHKDSSSTGKESPLKYYYLSRNRLLYAYRNLFDWKLPVSILYQTMIVCPKNILTALGKGKKTIAKAHWEGTKAFFKLRNKDKQP